VFAKHTRNENSRFMKSVVESMILTGACVCAAAEGGPAGYVIAWLEHAALTNCRPEQADPRQVSLF
jgi:hypothetical protein